MAARAAEPVTRGAVEAAAHRLLDAGIGAGSRVALRVDADSAGIAALLGAAEIGACVSPMHPSWTEHQFARALGRFRPSAVVTGGGDPEFRGGEGPGVARENGDGHSSWVLWTSGTSSGDPRGVVLSYRALRTSARAVAVRLDLRPEDRWLCTLSPAHVGGLALILRTVVVGCRLFAPGRFDVERTLAALDSEGITHVSLVPTQLRRLLEARGDRPAPSSLRAVLVGGAAAPRDLVERAIALGYPVALTWGMTEAASQVATAEPDRVRRKPYGVGPPLDGVELRIAAEPAGTLPDSAGDDAGGEVWIRSRTMADGLFVAPGEPLRSLVDPEGWYHTGDVGRIDPEGDLVIVGRIAERIITGGVNVSPAEVEAALVLHPAIRQAAVIGLPDPEWGERVTAFVVLRPGMDSPDPEAIRDFLRARLSPPALPRAIHYRVRLPLNANGKVDRRKLVTPPADHP